MKASPTQLTLRELKRRGFTSEVVEHFVRFPPPGHRKDLFGCIDVLAVGLALNRYGGTEPITLAVQACRRADVATRLTKMQAEERAHICVQAGWVLEVWGWGKLKASGAAWVLRREPLSGPLVELPARRAAAT